MAKFKVKYNCNAIFKKSRVSCKDYDLVLDADATLEEILKNKKQLKSYVIEEMDKKLKNGKVFSLDIIEITQINE